MKLVKLFIFPVVLSVLSGCDKDNDVYGKWSGTAHYQNSYSAIIGELPDPQKNQSSMPLEGTRSVKIIISESGCKIAFDLELDCIYDSAKKVIIIPSWRNEESEHDTGLMITNLNDTELNLKNEYTRYSFESLLKNEGIKYQMNGMETYVLKREK